MLVRSPLTQREVMSDGVEEHCTIGYVHDLLGEAWVHGHPCTVRTNKLRCRSYKLFEFLHGKLLKLFRVGDKSEVE